MLKGAACAPARCRCVGASAPRCRRKRPSEDGRSQKEREKESRETGEVGRQRRKRKRRRRGKRGENEIRAKKKNRARARVCNLRAHHTRVNCSGPLRRGCRERERHGFLPPRVEGAGTLFLRGFRDESSREVYGEHGNVECVSHLELSDGVFFPPGREFSPPEQMYPLFYPPPYLPSERLLLLFTSFLTFFVLFTTFKNKRDGDGK